jgi:hypothetical protein
MINDTIFRDSKSASKIVDVSFLLENSSVIQVRVIKWRQNNPVCKFSTGQSIHSCVTSFQTDELDVYLADARCILSSTRSWNLDRLNGTKLATFFLDILRNIWKKFFYLKMKEETDLHILRHLVIPLLWPCSSSTEYLSRWPGSVHCVSQELEV